MPSVIEFLKLWKIALIDLEDDTGSYKRAENSYPPAYLVCQINTAAFLILSVPSMI